MKFLISLIRFLVRIFARKDNYKLIIYKADRIGDFILSIGAIELLLKKHSRENVLLLVSPFGASLMEYFFNGVKYRIIRCPFPDRLLHHPFQFLKDFLIATRLQTDQLVCLNHYKQEAIYLIESAIEAQEVHHCLSPHSVERLSHLKAGALKYPTQAPRGACVELVAHHKVVQMAIKQELTLDSILPNRPASQGAGILVSPFGSQPLRNLAPSQVAWAVRQSPGSMPITLIGEPSMENALNSFQKELLELDINGCAVKILICVSLKEYVDQVSSADFVISTETATAHLAVLFNKPGIGFLGGGHFGYFAPWGLGPFKWIYKRMDCYGCNWHCIYPTIRCITELP